MHSPAISVVMGVCNGADMLSETVDSVLAQTDADFEFIIVNDGSTEMRVEAVLEAYTNRDPRIRVIAKGNEGLTRALIDGCAAATGKYIARIDVGDRYLAGRLSTHYQFMEAHPELAFSSCWSRYVDDEGRTVSEVCRRDTPEEARIALRANRPGAMKGITHHGAVLFRRDIHDAVGGYRAPFYFAQDMDLCVRMTDHHGMAFLPEILYEARFSPSSISSLHHRRQMRLGRLIIRMRRLRDLGMPDDALLDEAAVIRPLRLSQRTRVLERARSEYFAGCQYRHRHPQQAAHHFRLAVTLNPLHWKAALRLMHVMSIKGRSMER